MNPHPLLEELCIRAATWCERPDVADQTAHERAQMPQPKYLKCPLTFPHQSAHLRVLDMPQTLLKVLRPCIVLEVSGCCASSPSTECTGSQQGQSKGIPKEVVPRGMNQASAALRV